MLFINILNTLFTAADALTNLSVNAGGTTATNITAKMDTAAFDLCLLTCEVYLAGCVAVRTPHHKLEAVKRAQLTTIVPRCRSIQAVHSLHMPRKLLCAFLT